MMKSLLLSWAHLESLQSEVFLFCYVTHHQEGFYNFGHRNVAPQVPDEKTALEIIKDSVLDSREEKILQVKCCCMKEGE